MPVFTVSVQPFGMTPATFTVSGQPIAQPRPRVVTIHGRSMSFVPKSHPIHAYRQAIALTGAAAGLKPHGGPVFVWMEFVVARPKSHWRKNGLASDAPLLLTGKPDGDNLQKGVLDALIGVAYTDDSQAVEWGGKKRYAERDESPHTRITVRAL